MRAFLTRPRTLWLAFAATLLLTLVFIAVMAIWDFTVIDEMSDPETVRAHVEAMTPQQRRVHARLTMTTDLLYPVAYSTFFAGMALRWLGRAGPLFAAVAFLVVPFDLLELVAQVQILGGDFTWLPVKAVATPAKLALYLPALAATLVAAAVAARSHLRRS